MSTIAQKAAELIDMLPQNDREFAYEFIKRLVLAWDPDYTKLTPKEAEELEQAEKEMNNGEYFSMDEINWE